MIETHALTWGGFIMERWIFSVVIYTKLFRSSSKNLLDAYGNLEHKKVDHPIGVAAGRVNNIK